MLWRLTGGTNHSTDATNASRTMLFNIVNNKWDKQILDILKIPEHILPEVKDCSDDFGHTDPKITGESFSITGMVGDQQSATIGQCCFELKTTLSYRCRLLITNHTCNRKRLSCNLRISVTKII